MVRKEKTMSRRILVFFILIATFFTGLSFPQSANAVDIPVTDGMLSNFTAANFSSNTWTNSKTGGSGNATATGTASVVSVAANAFGNTKAFQAVQGARTDSIDFGNAALPATYTLFTVARYNPDSPTDYTAGSYNNDRGRNRIFSSKSGNWLSGFWAGYSGVAFHEGWKTSSSVDTHQNNWVLSSDVSAPTYRSTVYNSYSSKGSSVSTTNTADTTAHGLIINGGAFSGETSNFQVAAVISYNRVLTVAEIKKMEAYLADVYGIPANVPATMAVNAGNNQSAAPSGQVTTAPSVLVKDSANNVVEGATVTFAVASGGGSLGASGTVVTNASGIATSPAWTLGSSPGSNTLTASVEYLSNVTFTATSTDTVAPTSSANIVSLYTNSTSVSVNYTASDAGTIASVTVYYSTSPSLTSPTSCGSTTSAATSGTITCTVAATNTTYYVYTRATDAAGNVEAAPVVADDSVEKNNAISLTGVTQDLRTTFGVATSDTITATGGTGNKSFVLTGTANAGITLDTSTVNTAILKVSSSVGAGTYYETITATDSLTASATFAITLTVAQAISLTATNGSMSKGYGVAATETITATLGTGNKILTLTNLTGESNISIDTSTTNVAVLRVGAGATTGTYAVTINAVDSVSATASLSITISVSTASAITITAATPSAFTYSPSGISLTNSYSSAGLVASDSVQSITYSYSQFSSCATGGSCQIGEEGPGGGRVFYDAGSTQSWGRYLELSPQGWNGTANDPTAPWCTGVGGNSLVGTQAGIGKGKLNTDLMIAACNAGDAANLANSYRGGGKSDWYLANFQEMEQLVINASSVGYSYTMHTLWVSWEWTTNGAQDDVAAAFSYKNSTIGVRPIRAFSITSNVDTSTVSAIPTNAGTYYIVPSAVTLTSSHQSNYAAINYVNGVLTINRAEDSGFMSYSTAEAVIGNSYSLYVVGGSGTGTVTYLVTGGTASGCSITGSILIATSAGTCIVQFTRAQSTNYNAKSSSVTITFRTYEVLTTAATTSDSSSHGIVISGGGTPWSKNATASPTITSFTPSSGPVGTTITITGTGLNGVTVVRLNFEDMTSVTGVSPTSVTAVVQSGATSGPIYIENSYGADFNFDGFTVTP